MPVHKWPFFRKAASLRLRQGYAAQVLSEKIAHFWIGHLQCPLSYRGWALVNGELVKWLIGYGRHCAAANRMMVPKRSEASIRPINERP